MNTLPLERRRPLPMARRILVTTLAMLLAGCDDGTGVAREPAAPGAEAAPGTATISPDSAAAAGIETREAGPADIRETLTLYGAIRQDAERQQDVRARYPGVVRSVAKRLGDVVGKGDVLLSVESNDSLEPYAIRSPLAGTVIERRVNPGETVSGTETLLVIADLSSVWAEFAVFTRDAARVRAGQRVSIRDGDGGVQAEATLTYVAPVSNGPTQSVVARAVVDNRDGRWVAGQFVTGEIVVGDHRALVTVVPAALQQIDGEPVVFTQTPNGFAARALTLGRRDATRVEVVDGLRAGERYVAKNSFLVKAEVLKSEAEED